MEKPLIDDRGGPDAGAGGERADTSRPRPDKFRARSWDTAVGEMWIRPVTVRVLAVTGPSLGKARETLEARNPAAGQTINALAL